MIRLLEEVLLTAWPAIQTVWLDGWVLRFANGYTKRSNSVNPLYPSTQEPIGKIEESEGLYRKQGLKSVFKITPASQPADLDAILATRGYQVDSCTSAQLLDLDQWYGTVDPEVVLSEKMTAEWLDAYCTMGRIESRYQATLCQMMELMVPAKCLAVVRREGQVVACGLGVRQGRFMGLFDIVVDEAVRRQGYGRRLVESLLIWGKREGAHLSYLQVMVGNEPALKLYARLGFREEYRYWYRVKA